MIGKTNSMNLIASGGGVYSQTVTLTNNETTNTITINHNLGVVPSKFIFIARNINSTSTYSWDVHCVFWSADFYRKYWMGDYYGQIVAGNTYMTIGEDYSNYIKSLTATSITLYSGDSNYFFPGEYELLLWE